MGTNRMTQVHRCKRAEDHGCCCVCGDRIGDGDLVIRGYGGTGRVRLFLHSEDCAPMFVEWLERRGSQSQSRGSPVQKPPRCLSLS